jgi:NhaC family Na+:H+ antiporter
MAGVLGIATGAYLPYCFFNLLSPVVSLIYGFTGFRIEHIQPTGAASGPAERPIATEGGAA